MRFVFFHLHRFCLLVNNLFLFFFILCFLFYLPLLPFCLFPQFLNLLGHLIIHLCYGRPNVKYFFEKLWKLWQHILELFHSNNSKSLPFSFSSESFNNKLKGNLKEGAFNDSMLNNCTKDLGNFIKIWRRIPMEEPIFIKQTMKHASIHFLFLLNRRCFKPLHCINQFNNLRIYLLLFCWKYSLEEIIGLVINFFSALRVDCYLRE